MLGCRAVFARSKPRVNDASVPRMPPPRGGCFEYVAAPHYFFELLRFGLLALTLTLNLARTLSLTLPLARLALSDLEVLPFVGPFSDYYPEDSISAELLRLLTKIPFVILNLPL